MLKTRKEKKKEKRKRKQRKKKSSEPTLWAASRNQRLHTPSTSRVYRPQNGVSTLEEEISQMGCAMPEDSGAGEVEALRDELEDLKELINTLLTIIMEEADGVQSGAAPSIPDQPKRGYCM
jgi:hypothetical protein